MSTNIKNTEQFKEEIRCCRELKIERHRYGITYTHHVFVGKVDGEGCDLYHYSSAMLPFIKARFPCKIKKVRLTYEEHDTCQETLDIFDFNKDEVCIAERDDYPIDQKAEEKCIRKAESRLGEEKYSPMNNNCESYVNWIFSNDNTSLQSENCDLTKKALGNAIDGLGSSGILRPLGYLTTGIVHHFKKSKKETSETNLQNSDFETENSLSEKTNETKVLTLAKQFETKVEQTHSGIFVNYVEKAHLQNRETKVLTLAKQFETKMEQTHSGIFVNYVEKAHLQNRETNVITLAKQFETKMEQTHSGIFVNYVEKAQLQNRETKVITLAKQFETKMEQTHSGIFLNNVENAYSQNLEKKTKKSKIQTHKDKTNKTNAEHFDKKIDNTKPLNYNSTEKAPTHKMKKHTKASNSLEPGREAKEIQPDKFDGEKEETQYTNIKDNAKEKTKRRKISLSQKLEKERNYAKEEQLRENSENAQHQESSKGRDTEQTQRFENAKVQKLEAENAKARKLKDKNEAKNVQSEKLKDQSYKSHQQQTGNKTDTKPSEKFQNKNEFVKEQTFGSQSYEANHINLWFDESVLTVGKGLVGASTMCSKNVRNALENSDALKTILEQQFKKSAKKQISKCVCQKAKDEGIKKISESISKAGVVCSVIIETVSLSVNIINIVKDNHMTPEQKNRSISREVVTSASGFVGTIFGQAFIPIPVIGSVAGGIFGNMFGNILGGRLFF